MPNLENTNLTNFDAFFPLIWKILTNLNFEKFEFSFRFFFLMFYHVDNPRDLWHLRHWFQLIHNNHNSAMFNVSSQEGFPKLCKFILHQSVDFWAVYEFMNIFPVQKSKCSKTWLSIQRETVFSSRNVHRVELDFSFSVRMRIYVKALLLLGLCRGTHNLGW